MSEPATVTRPWWRTKPFLIIVIAGCFHVGRGAPADGAIFLATAAALAVAELTEPRPPATRDVPAATALAAVPAGWLVATWQPGTVPVAVAVAATGPPMLVLALRAGGSAERTDPTVPGAGRWWPWAAVGVAICLWELASFLQQSDPAVADPDHPTLSAVLEPLFAAGPGRIAAVVCWLAAGVLLARLMLGTPRCTR